MTNWSSKIFTWWNRFFMDGCWFSYPVSWVLHIGSQWCVFVSLAGGADGITAGCCGGKQWCHQCSHPGRVCTGQTRQGADQKTETDTNIEHTQRLCVLHLWYLCYSHSEELGEFQSQRNDCVKASDNHRETSVPLICLSLEECLESQWDDLQGL